MLVKAHGVQVISALCMGPQAQVQSVITAFYLQLDFLDLGLPGCSP